MSNNFFDHPILNSPYAVPSRHHDLDKEGQPLDRPPVEGRRRSELITPVPKSRRKPRSAEQASFVLPDADDLSTAEPEYNPTGIINEIRGYVASWRALPNPEQWGVTPATQRLLAHWRRPDFPGIRPFFCQNEAVETAIWLTEVALRDRHYAKFSAHLKGANEQSNPELFRTARLSASRWLAAKARPVFFSPHGIARSASIPSQGDVPTARPRSRSAISCSAR